MNYGFVIPGGPVTSLPRLARIAEETGWDAVFIPDCIYIDGPYDPAAIGFDPWVALAAMAVETATIRLGTMITPLSRRRPWKVARETTTIDHLSNGRLILPVGLGALDDGGFGKVGEATDRRTRAELLDESLAIIAGLWSGQPFAFEGKHYNLDTMTFQPAPIQQPRIPVWVVGAWPRDKSMGRAIRWDGLLPNVLNPDGTHATVTPEAVAEMAAWVAANRDPSTPFDIVAEGETPGDDAAAARAQVKAFEQAGATWWIESMWQGAPNEARITERIRQGPPRG